MKIKSEYKERIILVELTVREAKAIRDLLGATDKHSHVDSPEMYELFNKELDK